LFLVVLGTVVAAFAGRLRIPAPALLVIAGLVVGLLPRFPPVHVPPDAVGLVVLPPLLYAPSEDLPWRDLRAVWRPVTVLAVGLVLASAAAVAAVTWAVAAVPVSLAFVLGAVLASTDPVVVSALGRRLSLPPKVQALVQLPDRRLGPAAVGALEVAVLHERDRCPVRAAHVIALRVDGHRQVDDGVGGAEQRAGAQPFGQQRGEPEDDPAER